MLHTAIDTTHTSKTEETSTLSIERVKVVIN